MEGDARRAFMNYRQIAEILSYPDRHLIEHAVHRANLTKHEWETIQLREYESETIESAAERLSVSAGTIKNRYRSGMEKLSRCWASIPWIHNL